MSGPRLFELGALAHARPDATAFVWADRDLEAWTWRETAERVGGVCMALHELGVRPGDRLAVVGGNAPEWILLREAAEWMGLGFVPVGPKLAPRERDWMLINSETRWRFGDPAVEPGEVTVRDWRTVTDVPRAPLPQRSVGASPLQLLYTSGSGGVPKGALRPAASDDRRTRQSVAAYGLRPDDVHLLAGPLYHSGPAIFYRVFRQLGAPQMVLSRFDAAAAIELAAGEVDAVFMVPTMWRLVLEAAGARRPRLRVAWSAGSALDPATRGELLDWLGEGVLWEFYGATETGTVTILPPDKQRSHGHTVGFPAPGVSLAIRGDGGRFVEPGTPGRVYVRSPAAMLDYHHGPGSPKDLVADRVGDWLSVGDRGVLQPDGSLVLHGREGGMVITGGINVHPEEVEAALRAMPGVREAVVVGLGDATWGQALAAVVEPVVGVDLKADRLETQLRAQLAGYKIPKRWAVAAIPRTPSGKVMRADETIEGVLRRSEE